MNINRLVVDAKNGDSFSYGIKPSLLSNVIKIPIAPRVRLNSVVHNVLNNNYDINFVVYYDDTIIENQTCFIISDKNGDIIQTILDIKRMQFLTIQTNTRNILNIRTRFKCGLSYIDSVDIKILK